MNGVEYSASIMVHIVHATFCICALIKMNHKYLYILFIIIDGNIETNGCSDEEIFIGNKGTGKRRKKDKKRFMHAYICTYVCKLN